MKTINTYQNNGTQTDLIKLQEKTQTISHQRHPATNLNDTEILTKLGFTGRQARVYLALIKAGKAKAKIIADLSEVNRQEIYRILEDLQHIGVVRRNISTPTTYTATPITNVIKTLLAQKTAELTVIRKKTKQLTKKLQNNPHTLTEYNQQPCIGTIYENDKGKKYRQAIQATRQNINMITSWKRFKQLTTLLESQLQNALQNNVTIHIATDKPPNQPLPTWITNPQPYKNDQLKLKILQTQPTAAVTIFDQTTTAIAFDPDTSITKGPALWTTNPTLTALSQAYFNNIWKCPLSSHQAI